MLYMNKAEVMNTVITQAHENPDIAEIGITIQLVLVVFVRNCRVEAVKSFISIR